MAIRANLYLPLYSQHTQTYGRHTSPSVRAGGVDFVRLRVTEYIMEVEVYIQTQTIYVIQSKSQPFRPDKSD